MKDNISEENANINEDEQPKETFIKKNELENSKNMFKYIESFNINMTLDIKRDKFSYHYKYIKKVNKEIIYR